MNVVSNECGLKWMWSQSNVVSNECGLKWMWSQMNVVSNERDLKWMWSPVNRSQMNVVSNECGLKWMWSQMNVVSNEQVSYECGLRWTGIKWMWSQMNRSNMNVVSNKQVSNVVVSSGRGLKWSGLKWMVLNELVSVVCTPVHHVLNKMLWPFTTSAHTRCRLFLAPISFRWWWRRHTFSCLFLNENRELNSSHSRQIDLCRQGLHSCNPLPCWLWSKVAGVAY